MRQLDFLLISRIEYMKMRQTIRTRLTSLKLQAQKAVEEKDEVMLADCVVRIDELNKLLKAFKN
jgi:hypothetical protein